MRKLLSVVLAVTLALPSQAFASGFIGGGGVTGTVGPSQGGTGITATPTDGQTFIGKTSTGSYALSVLTPGAGVSITNGSGTITISASGTVYTGTANQVIVTGTVLSTPQDIGTASSVQFGAISVPGSGGATSQMLGAALDANAAGATSYGNVASAHGTNSLAMGRNALAIQAYCVALGANTSVNSVNGGTGVGYAVVVDGTYNGIAMGSGAVNHGSQTILMGCGPAAVASGGDLGVYIGDQITETGTSSQSVLIGATANLAAHINCVGLGYAVAPSAASQFVVGSSAAPITQVWIGNGPSGVSQANYNVGGVKWIGSTSGSQQWSFPATGGAGTLTWPAAAATTANYVLTNNGSGVLSWAAGGGGAGSLSATLAVGNTTSMHDMIVSVDDRLGVGGAVQAFRYIGITNDSNYAGLSVIGLAYGDNVIEHTKSGDAHQSMSLTGNALRLGNGTAVLDTTIGRTATGQIGASIAPSLAIGGGGTANRALTITAASSVTAACVFNVATADPVLEAYTIGSSANGTMQLTGAGLAFGAGGGSGLDIAVARDTTNQNTWKFTPAVSIGGDGISSALLTLRTAAGNQGIFEYNTNMGDVILAGQLVASPSNPTVLIVGNYIKFGPGTGAQDVGLTRSATSTLQLLGNLVPTTNGGSNLGVGATGFGALFLDYTNTGTVGNVTINKPSGTVNLAALGSTFTVTDSLVTANSHVMVTLASDPGVALAVWTVCGSGSFTVNTRPATVNQTAIDFVVVGAD